MQEVINILGSLNQYLPWANLVVLVCIARYIEGAYSRILYLQMEIQDLEQVNIRLSEAIAQLAREQVASKQSRKKRSK